LIVSKSINDLLERLSSTDKTIWIIGGSQIYKEFLLTDMVSEIDLTILNGRWVPPAYDSIETKKQKSILFPSVPLEFTVESEEINKEDPSLLHRKYIKSYW